MTLTWLCVIFLVGVLIVLWHKPPQIIIRVDVSQAIPSNLKLDLAHQYVLPKKGEAGFEEPIPPEIVEYCEQESDEWAREARKRKVRQFRTELGSWDAAFKQLMKEDVID